MLFLIDDVELLSTHFSAGVNRISGSCTVGLGPGSLERWFLPDFPLDYTELFPRSGRSEIHLVSGDSGSEEFQDFFIQPNLNVRHKSYARFPSNWENGADGVIYPNGDFSGLVALKVTTDALRSMVVGGAGVISGIRNKLSITCRWAPLADWKDVNGDDFTWNSIKEGHPFWVGDVSVSIKLD